MDGIQLDRFVDEGGGGSGALISSRSNPPNRPRKSLRNRLVQREDGSTDP